MRYYTEQEIAARLGISRERVRKLRQDERILPLPEHRLSKSGRWSWHYVAKVKILPSKRPSYKMSKIKKNRLACPMVTL